MNYIYGNGLRNQRADPNPVLEQWKGSATHIGNVEVKAFWETAKAKAVAEKQGCYVFALQAAKGFRFWYVGKATMTMKQECLQAL